MNTMTAIIKTKEPRYVKLELIGESGVIHKKITLKNFIKILTNSSEKDFCGVEIGSIPNGYYNAKIWEDGFSVIVSIQAGRYPFQFFDSIYLIPFPRLVFKFTCNNGKVDEKECYAVKDSSITSSTKLYHYPFSNVHSNGKICFGGNQLPKCSKISDVDKLVNLFYSSASNNDLWKSEYVKEAYPALRILLEELNGKDFFPVEYLEPYSKNISELL